MCGVGGGAHSPSRPRPLPLAPPPAPPAAPPARAPARAPHARTPPPHARAPADTLPEQQENQKLACESETAHQKLYSCDSETAPNRKLRIRNRRASETPRQKLVRIRNYTHRKPPRIRNMCRNCESATAHQNPCESEEARWGVGGGGGGGQGGVWAGGAKPFFCAMRAQSA